ncbi:hypothetical protein K1719_022788 [Acacia pycnantha]|nr:hypothetical protein K1719_022788 [Acacia pycnantha]
MDKTKTSEEKKEVNVGDVVAGVAVLVVVGIVGGLLGLFGSDSKSRKTMKAPGRDFRIFRDDFQDDPAGYFRGLRNK